MLLKRNLLFTVDKIVTLVVVQALCLLFTVGCGGGNSEPNVKSLAISPSTLTLSMGVPGRIKAVGTFNNGERRDLTDSVVWDEAGDNVASVSSGGTVTPLAVGQTTIRARYGSVSASGQISVSAAKLISMSISPTTATLPLGKGTRLIATGTFTDNSAHDISSSVIWSSSNPTVVAVAQNGQLKSSAVGTAIVSAVQGKIASSTHVAISDAALTTIAVNADSTVLALGHKAQLKAQATFTDGSSLDVTNTVTWSSSAPNVVAIGPGGVAQAKGVGTANVIAALGAISGAQAIIATAATLSTMTVSSLQALLPVGTTTQLTATGTYSDGTTQDLTASVQWSSSSPNIVAIGSGGLAQAKAVGTANVTAALGPVSGAQALTATAAALNTITVSSSQALLPVGTTTQLTAIGNYSDGSVQDLTASVNWWSSSQQTVAVNGAGVASAIAIGSARLVATSGSVSGSTLLAVSPAALVSVNVSPQTSLIPIGQKQQLSAIGSFTDGTTYDLTSYVNWGSDNAQVAPVDSHGMVFAANVGSANVQASYQAMVGTAAVKVQPQLNIVYFHLPQDGPDTTLRISNPGLTGADLCAMIYVFDQKQQLVECCGCPVSRDGLLVLSVRNDLMANPLTGIKSTDGVIAVFAADHLSNPYCDASSISPSGTLTSWSTNLGSIGNSTYTILEDNAALSPLSDQQLSASQAQCSFAKTLGSGQGTCSCGTGN